MPDLQTVRRPLNSGATDAKRAGLFLSSASSAGFTPSYVSFKHDRHTTAESPVFYASRTFLYRRASPQGSGTRDKITRDERTQVPGTRQAASRSLRRPRIPGPRRSDVRAPTFTYVNIFFTFHEGIMFLCLGPTLGQALCAGRVVTCVLGSVRTSCWDCGAGRLAPLPDRKGFCLHGRGRKGARAEPHPHSTPTSDALLPAAPPGLWAHTSEDVRGHLYLDVLRLDLNHVPVLPGGSSSTEPLQPEISESFSTHPASPPPTHLSALWIQPLKYYRLLLVLLTPAPRPDTESAQPLPLRSPHQLTQPLPPPTTPTY